MSPKMVRVLVVDDSPTARMAVRAALETDPTISVVGEASHGEEALRLTRRLSPDLVTMDVYLKSGDGIEVTSRIMAEAPTAVVVVTSLDAKNPNLVYRAVEAGALEVMGKPPRPGSPTYDACCRRFTRLVRTLASVHVIRRRPARGAVPERLRVATLPASPALSTPRSFEPRACNCGLLVIGASTGGPPAIRELLDGLPHPMPVPIALVQHMMPDFIGGFADWLEHETRRRILVVADKMMMRPDTVYVAPDDQHLEVLDSVTLGPTRGAPVLHQRPAVDRLFESAAAVMGSRTIAVLLTGMGRDGALGLLSLSRSGAITLVQDPETCVVPGMPCAALELGAASAVLSVAEMATQIGRWLPGSGSESGLSSASPGEKEQTL